MGHLTKFFAKKLKTGFARKIYELLKREVIYVKYIIVRKKCLKNIMNILPHLGSPLFLNWPSGTRWLIWPVGRLSGPLRSIQKLSFHPTGEIL